MFGMFRNATAHCRYEECELKQQGYAGIETAIVARCDSGPTQASRAIVRLSSGGGLQLILRPLTTPSFARHHRFASIFRHFRGIVLFLSF
jgi:hypothetical protein